MRGGLDIGGLVSGLESVGLDIGGLVLGLESGGLVGGLLVTLLEVFKLDCVGRYSEDCGDS